MTERIAKIKELHARRDRSKYINLWYNILDIHEVTPFTGSTFDELSERVDKLIKQQDEIIESIYGINPTK